MVEPLAVETSRSPIHVTCAADAVYGPYAGISLSSVLESNHGSKLHIHLFSDGIAQRDLDRVEQMAASANAELSIYDVRKELDKHPALTLRNHAHYSRAAYIRVFIPLLLPKEVNWIVYLDCDVICVDSWSAIWARRQDIQTVGAAIDPWVDLDRIHKKSLGLPEDQPYYGSGVLLINVDAWRQHKIGEKLLEFIEGRGPTRYIDQDAINCILGKEITEMPGSWNALVTSPHRKDVSSDLKQAVNIHFCSGLKPWHLGYRLLQGAGASAFAAAKSRSPWRWMLPDFQTRRIKRKIRQKLGVR